MMRLALLALAAAALLGPVALAQQCPECQTLADNVCQPVADGTACGNSPTTTCFQGVCVVNTPPISCPECQALADGVCQPVADGTACGDGSGGATTVCFGGVCVVETPTQIPTSPSDTDQSQEPTVPEPSPEIAVPEPSPAEPILPPPTPAPPAGNLICPAPTGPIVGGYTPTDVMDLPQGLEEAVFKAFLAQNFTVGNATFSGCKNTTLTPILACSQVVAGTNYKLFVDAECDDPGQWKNNVSSVVIAAAVFEPLPGSGKPLNVTVVKPLAVVIEAPDNNATCPDTYSPMPDRPSQLMLPSYTLLILETLAEQGPGNCTLVAFTPRSLCYTMATLEGVPGTSFAAQLGLRCAGQGQLGPLPIKGANIELLLFQPDDGAIPPTLGDIKITPVAR